VGERPTLAVEEDRDVVGRGPQPHRLTAEPLLAGPDPHVVPLRERVVLLLEHEVGGGALKLLDGGLTGASSFSVSSVPAGSSAGAAIAGATLRKSRAVPNADRRRPKAAVM